MDDYTTRHIRGMNVSCNAVLNSDLTKGFDVLLYKIELIRPNGSSFVLEDFSGSAWPGTALSDDVPTGGTGKSLLIHCAPNTTTTVARPFAAVRFDAGRGGGLHAGSVPLEDP